MSKANVHKELFNYTIPHFATRTLKKLNEKFPDLEFKLVMSPLPEYQFKYLISMRRDGRHVAFVEKCKF